MERSQVFTKLCDEIHWMDFDKFKELLDLHGTDFQIDGEEGYILLSKAVRYSRYEATKLLLERGAKVNLVNTFGETPLHLAANCYINFVQLLLKKKADVNAANCLGIKPLHVAVKASNFKVIQLLLQNKAEVNAVDCFGKSALFYAANRKESDTVRLLLENGADVNLGNQYGRTPLHAAVIRGYARVVKMLLQYGPDVNLVNNSGRTPIFGAANRGHIDILKMLLAKRAVVNIADNSGRTPLRFAVRRGHVRVVELLLRKDAAVNAPGPELRTPLHEAVDRGYLKIAKLLLKKKAFVNPADTSGITPLHGAANDLDVKMVKLLLENEASVNAADRYGRTPLDVAVDPTYVSKNNPNSQKSQIETVKLLLKKESPVNTATRSGTTPLHVTVELEHVEIVELLLQQGAQVNVKDHDGNTPLHHAVYRNHSQLVELILQKGAAVNAEEKNGETPLHAALKANSIKHEIVDLLPSYGANVNACDSSYETPLFFAIEHCSSDVVGRLIKHFLNSGHDSLAQAVRYSNQGVDKVSDPTDVTDDVTTILHVASANDSSKIIDEVLKHCVNLNNTQNCDVFRALALLDHKPCFKDIPIVQTLLTYEFSFAKEVDNADFIYAVISKRCDNVFVELLKNGFVVNKLYTMDRGKSFLPLHLAVRGNCVNAARLLISHGADVNAQDARGYTAILSSDLDEKDGTDLQICELLLKNQSNTKDNSKFLCKAIAMYKRIDIVKLLLKYDTDANYKDSEGSTALHHAVLARGSKYWPQCDAVKLLLTSGADVNAKTNAGVSVLHVAALLNPKYIEVFKTLLECNPDVNVSCSGVTPLHLCALTKNDAFCQLLLSKGAKVNASLNNKKTALHVAVSKNPCSVAFKTFLEGLQSSTLFTICRKTVLDWKIVEKEVRDPFLEIGDAHLIDELISCGAEINLKDDDGKTALHYAAENCLLIHLRALIQHGADVMARDNFSNTALHCAGIARKPSLEIVRALVSVGADINCRDSEGCTVLHKSVQIGGQFTLDLLDLGCDVNVLNKDNRTPLEEACYRFINFRRLGIRNDGKDEKSFRASVLRDFAIPCLMQQVVKLKAAGLYVERKNLHVIGGVCYDTFYNKCMHEVNTMKMVNIVEHTSYYDILRKRRNQLVRLANDDDLVMALEEYTFDGEIQEYAPEFRLIIHCLLLANRRKRLLDSSIGVFRSCIWDLPVECVDFIFDDLSDGDLENLMRAYYPDIAFPGEIDLMCDDVDHHNDDKFESHYSSEYVDLDLHPIDEVNYDSEQDRDSDSSYSRDFGFEYWRDNYTVDSSSDEE